MTVQSTFQLLAEHPMLSNLTIAQLVTAITLARCLKRDISLPQPLSEDSIHAPSFLPPAIQEFLGKVLELNSSDVGYLWDIMKDSIWELPTEEEAREMNEKHFEKHGWERELSEYTYFVTPALI